MQRRSLLFAAPALVLTPGLLMPVKAGPGDARWAGWRSGGPWRGWTMGQMEGQDIVAGIVRRRFGSLMTDTMRRMLEGEIARATGWSAVASATEGVLRVHVSAPKPIDVAAFRLPITLAANPSALGAEMGVGVMVAS